jgi:two-component system, OmpR family, sensor histidine kinase MtrB
MMSSATPVPAGAPRGHTLRGSELQADATTASERLGTNLEEFLALIAHEVNTPLAIVRSAAESLLGNDHDPEHQRELLEMIVRNADLSMLLMRRVGLARDIEAGTVELHLESVDLTQLVELSVQDLRQAVLEGHPLDMAAPESLAVLADATAAREIVFNLLSNAAKYSSEDAPIELRLALEGDMARLVVRNHGTGVTPGETDEIFEKFFQADAGSPGVGLGLFVSRGLARAHGGDISVRPAEESGSEFVLELPVQSG